MKQSDISTTVKTSYRQGFDDGVAFAIEVYADMVAKLQQSRKTTNVDPLAELVADIWRDVEGAR